MPTVTVLIRTLNAVDYLGPLLDVLNRQSHQPLEILVVDSQSSDGTPQAAKLAGARVITIDRATFSHARSTNLGFSESRGEVVAMLSQDALPMDETWLESLIEPLQDDNVAAVFGRQIPRKACFPIERWEVERSYPELGEPGVLYSNVNSAARKGVWEQAGFDESVAISEDRFWANTIKQNGNQVAYSPQAAVWHSHDYSFIQLYKRCHAESSAIRQIEGKREGWGLLLKGLPRQVVRDRARLSGEGNLALWPKAMLYRGFQFAGLILGGRG